MVIRREKKRERLQRRLQKIREKKECIREKESEQYEIIQHMYELYMRNSACEEYTEKRSKVANRAIERLDNKERNLSIAERRIKRALRDCID